LFRPMSEEGGNAELCVMQGCTIVLNYVVKLTIEELLELLHECVYIL
jgi:hypothetical protein